MTGAPKPSVEHPISAEGVDLTQIRALKAMTPTERVRALVVAANNLIRLRKNVRRV
ncbi:MAG: hypothetical protein RIT81_32630 [Deltaproteobacteria bacterium]